MLDKTICNDISIRIASERMGQATETEPEPKLKRKYTMTPKVRNRLLEQHRWKKGQSGNPKGRPLTKISLTALFNDMLSEHPEDARAIARALIVLAKQGDAKAIDMSFDRNDGKVTEKHVIEGDFPIQIRFVPAQMLLDKKEQNVIEGEVREIKELGEGG